MATFNGDRYLEEQLDSIIEQSFTNWKLYIHDDGSTDGTINIIEEYANNYENIIYLDDNVKCGGAKENFTHLINNMLDDSFDYCMFSDQDDVWRENKIEKTLIRMQETESYHINKPILIHTDLIVVDEELNIVSESMRKSQRLDIAKQNKLIKMCTDSIVSGCTVMINKNLFELSKEIPKEAIMHDTWIPLIALKFGGVIEYLSEGTLYYRQHNFNTMGTKKINIVFYLQRLVALKTLVKEYMAMYLQCQKAGINLSSVDFIYNRALAIAAKIFKNDAL